MGAVVIGQKVPSGWRRLDGDVVYDAKTAEAFKRAQRQKNRLRGTRRESQPYMMGEGLGPRQWGMAPCRKDTPSSTPAKPETPEEKEQRIWEEELKAIKAIVRKKRKRMEKQQNQRR